MSNIIQQKHGDGTESIDPVSAQVLTTITVGATNHPQPTRFDIGNIMQKVDRDREGSLFTLPQVPFPKAMFTPERFEGNVLAMQECALMKLKINTGACIEGFRINDQLDPEDNPDHESNPYLPLQNLIIYKRIHHSEEVILVVELVPGNVLTQVEDDCTLIAKYIHPEPDLNNDPVEFQSEPFVVRVFEHMGDMTDPANIKRNRSVIVINETNVNESIRDRSALLGHLCHQPTYAVPNPEPAYLLVTTDIYIDEDSSWIIWNPSYGESMRRYNPPISLPPSGYYNGVIDGGWFKKIKNKDKTERWVHVRHRIPFRYNTNVRFVNPDGMFWVLSCYDKNRYWYCNELVINPPAVPSLENVSPMVVSFFMTDYNDTDGNNGCCYLVDLNYGRPGKGSSAPSKSFIQKFTIKVGDESGLTMHGTPDGTQLFTTPWGISWYGSARHFVNCVPMKFLPNDAFVIYKGNSDKFAPQFVFTIGNGTHTDSKFLGCMNTRPIRNYTEHKSHEVSN
jgi:hypothetical protein